VAKKFTGRRGGKIGTRTEAGVLEGGEEEGGVVSYGIIWVGYESASSASWVLGGRTNGTSKRTQNITATYDLGTVDHEQVGT